MVEHNGYKVAYFPAALGEGAVLCVVVGRSFLIDRVEGKCTPEDESVPLAKVDELHEGRDPSESSVKRASDFELVKLRTDVVLVGTAHAPGGKAVESWPVRLRIGKWSKELQVFGPRTCRFVAPRKKGKKKEPRPPTFSEPTPIVKVALCYENAFGGKGVFIPLNKEAYLAAQKKAQQVEARAQKQSNKKEASSPEIPEMSDEAWDKAGDQAPRAPASDGRVMAKGSGSASVGLEPEHLATRDGGTPILELDQMGAELSMPGEWSGEVDREGTPILAIADAGNERVVDGGWSEPLVPDKEKSTPARAKQVSEFPIIACRGNPVGKGFAISHAREAVEGLALPLIEDPRQLLAPQDIPCDLQELESAPQPAGFGPVPRSWSPRANFSGLKPEEEEAVRGKIDEYILTLDPEDPDDKAAILALADKKFPAYDSRLHNFAPSDQQLTGVKGDESVRVEGVCPKGPVEFDLPGRFPWATLDRGRGAEPVLLTLDTVAVDTDEDRVILVWRGNVPMKSENELLSYPQVQVEVEDLDISAATKRRQTKKKRGGTDVLEAVDEEGANRVHEPASQASQRRGGDQAWQEKEDREVSPLSSDNGEVAPTHDPEKADREKRRADVLALREKLLAVDEKKKKRKTKPKSDKKGRS